MILYTQRNRIGKERTEFILRRLMERKNSHSLIFPLVRKAELSAWEWNRSYCAEGAGFQSPFPLKFFPPQWERPARSGLGSFLVSPSMSISPSMYSEDSTFRDSRKFLNLDGNPLKNKEERDSKPWISWTWMNLDGAIPRSWSATKASKKEKKALTKREK